MLTLLREMSLRLLVRAPLRSGLVVLGIALGVAIFVASEATSNSLLQSFRELATRVTRNADLMVQANQAGVDGRWVADLVEVEGVAHAAASLEINTQLQPSGTPLLVMGVDFMGDTHFLPFAPSEGQEDVVEDPLSFANDPKALLITRTLAQQRNLAVDDTLSLLTAEGPREFAVRGILEDTGPAASFGGQVVVMALDTAQVAFNRGRQVDRIDLAVTREADVTAVQARVAAHVAGKAEVIRPERRGDRIQALVRPLQQGLRISGYVALIVGMFIIYNAVGVAVAQRRREIGLLRALGVLRRGIRWHFCLEAALLSLPGSAIGLLLSRLLIQVSHDQTLDALNQVYTLAPTAPTVTPTLAGQGFVAGIIMSIVAAWLPARRGAALDPVEALRASGGAPTRPIRARALAVGGLSLVGLAFAFRAVPSLGLTGVTTIANMVGAAMCAPALVLGVRRLLLRPSEAAFGVLGPLALDNVHRSLGRSTVNVLALWVAVAMSVANGGWLGSFEHAVHEWFDRVAASELSVTAGSPLLTRRAVPLSDDTIEALSSVPGVRAVQRLRKTEQGLSLGGLSLTATDVDRFITEAQRRGFGWDVVAGPDPIPAGALLEAPRVVLSRNAARRLELAVGDTLTLQTMEGEQALEVYAIVIDFSSERGAAFIEWETYSKLFHDPSVDGVNLFLDEGVDPQAIATVIREELGKDHLFVTETGELRKHFMDLLTKSFSHIRSLELIVLFIALFGVVGTLIAAVLDRVREIGMLRAIGAGRRQIMLTIVLEASFLGLCATLGGIAAGTLQCLLFLETVTASKSGWELPFVFPWGPTVRIALAVIGASALSGLIPGRQAAKLEIRDAIAYE